MSHRVHRRRFKMSAVILLFKQEILRFKCGQPINVKKQQAKLFLLLFQEFVIQFRKRRKYNQKSTRIETTF